MQIKFNNWEKYQKEGKRYESTSWFALDNKMWQHPLWDDLDGEQLKGYLFLLCQVSQRGHKTGEIEITPSTIARLAGIPETKIAHLIDTLKYHRVITVGTRGKTSGKHALHNITKPNITEHNSTFCTAAENSATVPATKFPDCFTELPIEFFRRANIKPATAALWVKTYPDTEWVDMEIKKAITWLDANPKRRPKRSFTRFIANWLSRGWEQHRKTIASNTPKEKTIDQIRD